MEDHPGAAIGQHGMQSKMTRVVVVGTSGTGKTTFSRRLAHILGAPHIELDALYWLPNWVPRPLPEFRTLVEQAIAQDSWVVDGNYSPIRSLVWSRATTVIWLNYAFPLVLWRALTRTVRRALMREALCADNRESLRRAFCSRESILWWVLTTFHRRRQCYRTLFDDAGQSQLVRVELCTPMKAEHFLAQLGREAKES
jgi:adenylate kinase family enzyme